MAATASRRRRDVSLRKEDARNKSHIGFGPGLNGDDDNDELTLDGSGGVLAGGGGDGDACTDVSGANPFEECESCFGSTGGDASVTLDCAWETLTPSLPSSYC